MEWRVVRSKQDELWKVLRRMPRAQSEFREHDHWVDICVVCTLEAEVPVLGCAVHGQASGRPPACTHMATDLPKCVPVDLFVLATHREVGRGACELFGSIGAAH